MLPEQARNLLGKIIANAEPGERAPFRALAAPRIRPYLPGGDAIRALFAGSGVLCRCGWRGVRWAARATFVKAEKPSSGSKEKAATGADRLEQFANGALCTVVAGAVVGGIVVAIGSRVAPYLPMAAGIAAPVWIVAALMVAPEKPQKPAAALIAETAAGPLLDTPEGRRLAFLKWLEKTTRGASGIHLDQMYHQLTQQEPANALPRHHLRPLLDHYGIPVQRTLRVGAVAGRSGVTRQAIEATLRAASATPPPGVESGAEIPMESGSDVRESPDSTPSLQAVERPLPDVVKVV